MNTEPKSFEKLKKFLDEVLPRVFGDALPKCVHTPESKYDDESLFVLNTFYVHRTSLDRWTLSAEVVVPGVRYRRDGSGEPDSVDVAELGEFDNDESLVWKMVDLFVKQNLTNAISDHGLAEMIKDEEELERKEGPLGPECDKPSLTLNDLYELEAKHPPLLGKKKCQTCGSELHESSKPGLYICIECALPD